jgi:Na+/melibiose symporter-like transporter
VPYTAWGAELSENYGERARITGIRESLQLAGVVAAAGVPFAAAALGVGKSGELAAISWVAVAAGIPALLLLLWKVPDRPVTDAPEKRRFKRADVKDIFSNRPFARLLSAWFINGLANGIPAALFPLYLDHVLQVDAPARGALILVYFLCGIAAIPLWVWLSDRFGKHHVWCGAMALACVAFVWVPLIPAGGVLAFSVVCAVTGMALGADLALPPAIQADVIDLDTLRHGRHRAGVFFALWSMGTKLALAAAVGFAFPTLDLLGFQVGGNNGAHALMALAVIYSLVPIVLKVVAIAMVWNYPITHRRQRAVRRLIERHERRAAQTLKQE